MANTITVALEDVVYPILRAALAEYREVLEAEGNLLPSTDVLARDAYWATATKMVERL